MPVEMVAARLSAVVVIHRQWKRAVQVSIPSRHIHVCGESLRQPDGNPPIRTLDPRSTRKLRPRRKRKVQVAVARLYLNHRELPIDLHTAIGAASINGANRVMKADTAIRGNQVHIPFDVVELNRTIAGMDLNLARQILRRQIPSATFASRSSFAGVSTVTFVLRLAFH